MSGDEDLDEGTADQLERERPRPAAPFRRDLSQRVSGAAVRLRIHRRPDHLWPIAAALTIAGIVLLGIAAAGV